MSIIVTGGAGMIGSNIIEGLNKSGHIAEKCAATFSSLGFICTCKRSLSW